MSFSQQQKAEIPLAHVIEPVLFLQKEHATEANKILAALIVGEEYQRGITDRVSRDLDKTHKEEVVADLTEKLGSLLPKDTISIVAAR